MSRYKSAVSTGAAIVWKLTFQKRSTSLRKSVHAPPPDGAARRASPSLTPILSPLAEGR